MTLSIGLLAAATALGVDVAAQPAQAADAMIKICPSVKGAKCIDEPAANTPVPAQFKASYEAYMAMKKAAHGGRKLTWTTKPDWSGLWTHAGGFNWAPQPIPLANSPGGPAAQAILDHCKSFPCKGWITAALTPKYAKQYREKLTAVAHGFEWDQLSNCLPAGYPRFLLEPFLREFVVTPGITRWTNEQQSETRRIYTDGRGHVPDDEAFLTFEGDSIGFWDGNTLVVNTIRVKPEEMQRNQPSISGEASTNERIRMINPNMIEDVATLYDPLALRAPWHGMQKYSRVTKPGARIDMWSCEENNNVVQTANGGSTFILPGETMMVERRYRNPDNYQNEPLDKAIAYGAKLMKEEQMKMKKAEKKD